MTANPSQGKFPVIRIENLGAGQKNVPFTFGQVFKVGALMPGQGLAGQLSNGDLVPLQIDQKATHADGSIRHAIISGVLQTLFEKEERELKLVTAQAGTSKRHSSTKIPDGVVEITLAGTKYTTNGSKFGDVVEWLSGDVVSDGVVPAELRDSKGNVHPHLKVRVGIRAYSTGQIRFELVLENATTFTPGAQNFTYDIAVKVGGKSVFSQKAIEHYHHARWRQVFWLGDEPQIHIKHDAAYLIATRAVPNYDQSVVPKDKSLQTLVSKLTVKNTGIMKIGAVANDMGSTGGRPDIGPLPSWAVSYLLSGDIRSWDVMIAAAEGSGAWSTHYRDENTGYPVRADNENNKKLSTHPNMARTGPLPVPRLVEGNAALTKTPYARDTAHQPSLTYLPYLLTGEYYYLEELQFWAAMNPLGTDSGNSGEGQGLVRWQQVRGQAWSLRTLGHAAYITPDTHPLKDYFVKQLDNNIEFYKSAYVDGNPNALGVYDGSGQRAFKVDASAPWQDDYLTWSFAHLVELGFDKALPVFLWKSKYAIGRMTDPGFCWIQASSYHMKFRESDKSPIYSTFGELYTANFGGDKIWHEGKTQGHPDGIKYIDQPCGSQAQADWLGKVAGFGWPVGRMAGYADSTTGYPANLQPALAVAVDIGAPGADKAWARFDSRAAKPDYSTGPQFAIVPREKEVEQTIPDEPKSAKVFEGTIGGNGVISVSYEGFTPSKSYTVVVIEENK